MWQRGKRRKKADYLYSGNPTELQTASRAESPSEKIFDKFNHKNNRKILHTNQKSNTAMHDLIL